MADLISNSDKTAYEGVFDDIHDTFGRTIYIFKTQKKTFVATNNTYNALYSRIKDGESPDKEVEKVSVTARISYVNKQEYELGSTVAQLGLPISGGLVRIKIDVTGYSLLKSSTDIGIDGELFDVASDDSKAGLFTPKYHVIYLKRKD